MTANCTAVRQFRDGDRAASRRSADRHVGFDQPHPQIAHPGRRAPCGDAAVIVQARRPAHSAPGRFRRGRAAVRTRSSTKAMFAKRFDVSWAAGIPYRARHPSPAHICSSDRNHEPGLEVPASRDVAGEGAHSISGRRSRPLAARRRDLRGRPVARVFFGADFVAVTKAEGGGSISSPPSSGDHGHFQFGRPLIGEAAAEASRFRRDCGGRRGSGRRTDLDLRGNPRAPGRRQDGGDIPLSRLRQRLRHGLSHHARRLLGLLAPPRARDAEGGIERCSSTVPESQDGRRRSGIAADRQPARGLP